MWKKLTRRPDPFRSADYWRERYRAGRGSGAGSSGRHRAYSAWMAGNAPAFAVAGTWENPFALAEGGDPQVSSFAFFRLYERRPGGGR